MLEVAVIEDPAAAEVSLDPVRARLLAELAEPGSATMLAATVGLPRQKVNYHLRTLERHGLVELVEERRKGNVTERVMRATAASYVISPAALAAVQPDPARAPGPAVRALAARGRGAPGPGRRRAHHRRDQARKRVATFASTARSGSPPRPTGPRSPRSWRARSPGWSASTTTSRPGRSRPPGGRRRPPDPEA